MTTTDTISKIIPSGGTNWLLTLIIIIIFGLLFVVNILAVGIDKIKKEWPIYRCNPIIIPIANIFGHDTINNFSYCVQNLQSAFMQDFLAPVHYAENLMSEITKDFTESIHYIRAFFDKIRNMITSIIQEIMGVFLNFLIGIQHMIISIKDLFSKTIGTLALFMYVLEGAIMSMQSAWNGPTGNMVRFLCFHPKTLVKLNDGQTKMIKDIDPGDILKNNQTVHGTLKLHNLDSSGNFVENLYILKDGEYNENMEKTDILVSGSHLVFDYNKKHFIYCKDHSDAILSDMNSKTLLCLITSDHTIPLGEYIFHDWEDNQGSPSKNV